MENLRHSTVGYIDWNLVLDNQGGPNNVNNFIDATITLSDNFSEMYKQPIFYIMAHFSKFIPPGSVRIETNVTGGGKSVIRTLAFRRPDNKTTVILYNSSSKAVFRVVVRDAQNGKVTIRLKPKSINTLVYAY